MRERLYVSTSTWSGTRNVSGRGSAPAKDLDCLVDTRVTS